MTQKVVLRNLKELQQCLNVTDSTADFHILLSSTCITDNFNTRYEKIKLFFWMVLSLPTIKFLLKALPKTLTTKTWVVFTVSCSGDKSYLSHIHSFMCLWLFKFRWCSCYICLLAYLFISNLFTSFVRVERRKSVWVLLQVSSLLGLATKMWHKYYKQ